MLWIKALHIVFVTSWFAGLFYLPRIFVNLAQESDTVTTERLLLMARKLYRFMGMLALPALALGLVLLWMQYGGAAAGMKMPAWMHAKLAFVVLALGYHHACGAILKKFENGVNQRSHAWFRWFNEVPVVLLLAIVVLVVVKPF
ncbi:protoporphyrinogen IX oxidase [Janthinobacterium sp. CG_23.3]|uniref:CopD family protein n=1 Tax=unclassified Janthinobacterium TaxID=2610881 RepID=UPI00034D6D80|nr:MULTISPECIES: CopD family protein [unclassified Janthinobacterium]MEC5162407.1 putative membrane protein [Janthinobacterium sp. CG_S6]